MLKTLPNKPAQVAPLSANAKRFLDMEPELRELRGVARLFDIALHSLCEESAQAYGKVTLAEDDSEALRQVSGLILSKCDALARHYKQGED